MLIIFTMALLPHPLMRELLFWVPGPRQLLRALWVLKSGHKRRRCVKGLDCRSLDTECDGFVPRQRGARAITSCRLGAASQRQAATELICAKRGQFELRGPDFFFKRRHNAAQ